MINGKLASNPTPPLYTQSNNPRSVITDVYGVTLPAWPAYLRDVTDVELGELYGDLNGHNDTLEDLIEIAPWLGPVVDEINWRADMHAEHSSGGTCVSCFAYWPCKVARENDRRLVSAAGRPTYLRRGDVIVAQGDGRNVTLGIVA